MPGEVGTASGTELIAAPAVANELEAPLFAVGDVFGDITPGSLAFATLSHTFFKKCFGVELFKEFD